MGASEKAATVGHPGGLEPIRLSYERVVRERDELAAAVTRARARITRTIETVEDFDDARTHAHDDATEGDPECSACWLATLDEFVRALPDPRGEPPTEPREHWAVSGMRHAAGALADGLRRPGREGSR